MFIIFVYFINKPARVLVPNSKILTGPGGILLKFPIILTVPGGIKLKFSLYSVFLSNLHLCSLVLVVLHKLASIYYNNNSQQLYLSFEP